MRLTKSQLAALTAHAEQPAETPEQYVTDMVKLLDTLRGERSYYTGLVKSGGLWFTLGPHTTTGQAGKAAQAWAETVGGEWTVAHHWTPEGLTRHLGELDTLDAPTGDWGLIREDVKAFKAGWNGKSATRKEYV